MKSKEQVTKSLNGIIKSFESAKAKFMSGFEKSPHDALYWSGEELGVYSIASQIASDKLSAMEHVAEDDWGKYRNAASDFFLRRTAEVEPNIGNSRAQWMRDADRMLWKAFDDILG